VNSESQSDADPSADQPDMESLDEAKMGLLEHLAELRQRLVYSVICVTVGFVAAWFVHEQLFEWMLVPLQQGAPELDAAKMHHKDLAEPIYVFLKLSLLAGTILAAPGILYNIWKFIAPALYENERRLIWPFVIFGTIFFLLGASFCYFIVLPYGYNFLLEFSQPVSDPTLMMQDYFAITTKLMFGFAVIFELPVFSMFLAIMGVITHRTLLEYWRYAFVASFLLAALLTPPDIITQSMMAGPLALLYGLSIFVAWFFSKDNG